MPEKGLEWSINLHMWQKKVDKLIQKLGGYWEEAWLLTATMEELGELAKEMQIRNDLYSWQTKTSSTEKLREELGDVIFCLMCLANVLNIDLNEAIELSISKYEKRDCKKGANKNTN